MYYSFRRDISYNYLTEFAICLIILSQIKCVEIKDNVQIGKCFSHKFPVHAFEKINILSPLLLFNNTCH